MLDKLYQYAIDNGLTARPGFKQKNVKYYIHFDLNGHFLGFDILEDEMPKPYCPFVNGLNQGDKCDLIAEKAEIILNINNSNPKPTLSKKHQFYMESLKKASEYDKLAEIAYKGISSCLDSIKEQYVSDKKKKITDILSIKVDGIPLESSTDFSAWWSEYRFNFEKVSSDMARCLITGESVQIAKTVPKLNVSLPSSLDPEKSSLATLISFDKSAFRSYGLEQAENAPVSGETMNIVNSALEDLIRKVPAPLAGAINIHWFSQAPEMDILEILDFGYTSSENNFSEDIEETKTTDEKRIQTLFSFVTSKIPPQKLPKCKYYMMSLSATKTRVMIRQYDEGNYQDLFFHIQKWFQDICIDIPNYGKSYPKLFRIYSRLLKFSTNKTKLSERIAEELSGLAPQIMYAILHGTPLPDTAAAKALAYIRSDMYAGNDDNAPKIKNIDVVSCQILKAWLNRKYRNQNKEEFCIMDNLNEQSPSKAYQSGRLMAVYAALQRAALGDVGAGVVERYYTSACTSPALVMGKLATMAQYHLSKLEQGSKIYYSRMLQEISIQIGTSLPATFTLEEQSQFALGFYFQTAEIYKSKKINPETEE